MCKILKFFEVRLSAYTKAFVSDKLCTGYLYRLFESHSWQDRTVHLRQGFFLYEVVITQL